MTLAGLALGGNAPTSCTEQLGAEDARAPARVRCRLHEDVLFVGRGHCATARPSLMIFDDTYSREKHAVKLVRVAINRCSCDIVSLNATQYQE